MKQELISFIDKIDDEIVNLCSNLYNTPEESYNEKRSCTYITDILSKYNFQITKNYLDIPNSFFAFKGNTYPKICFLCEYDAIKDLGHITGHNALSSISVTAALALGNIIDKIGGSVVIIGCPGEYLGGTKNIMVKQGTFDDIDIVMECHPDIITAESGTSSAIIALSLKFEGNSGLSFLNKNVYNSLDGILLTFNILNSLLKGFPKNVEVNSILCKGGYTPLLLPIESEAKFYIRSQEYASAELVENKIREIAKYVSNLTNVKHSISLYEPPNEELNTNKTLNRLFSHNLKESGIIDIAPAQNISAGLSIGTVSNKVPCIHPYICICENPNIHYGTEEFASETLSNFAHEQIKKASLALACTGYDLIKSDTLLKEVKAEFYK